MHNKSLVRRFILLGLFFLEKFIKSVDIVALLWYYNSVRRVPGNTVASARKENSMEGMTNEQFKIVLNMIIQIIKDSDTKEEAIKKVEALVK